MDYGIDPFFGRENLVVAPNAGHTDEYTERVVNAIEAVKARGGSKEDLILELQEQAKNFIRDGIEHAKKNPKPKV